MYSDPVTYRKILRVLVIGFSAVIVLLMAAGFIGLKSAQLIQENSAEIVHDGLVTTRLIDELQREQDTLNAAFNKLSRGPELSERERLLSQLDDADQAVERIVAEAAGTPQAALWRQLSIAVQGFSREARRLLVRKNVPTYTSRDLLQHHEEVTAIVAKMIANNSSRTLAAQTRIDQRSAQLVQRIARPAGRLPAAGAGVRDLHRADHNAALSKDGAAIVRPGARHLAHAGKPGNGGAALLARIA